MTLDDAGTVYKNSFVAQAGTCRDAYRGGGGTLGFPPLLKTSRISLKSLVESSGPSMAILIRCARFISCTS